MHSLVGAVGLFTDTSSTSALYALGQHPTSAKKLATDIIESNRHVYLEFSAEEIGNIHHHPLPIH